MSGGPSSLTLMFYKHLAQASPWQDTQTEDPWVFFPPMGQQCGVRRGSTQPVCLPEDCLCLLAQRLRPLNISRLDKYLQKSSPLEEVGPMTRVLGQLAPEDSSVGWPCSLLPQQGKGVPESAPLTSSCHVTGLPFCLLFSNMMKLIWSGNTVSMDSVNQLLPS